jgi:DNA invertase Pin-like site-specific DNA recombinase
MGKPAKGIKPEKTELRNLYIKELKSIRDIADILGCSKDMVYRALKYDIQRRKYVEKMSQLKDFNLSYIKKEIMIKRFNRVASELAVHNTTLRRYIEKNKT